MLQVRPKNACRDSGFFYATGHGIPAELFARLDSASRKFFALSETEKLEIRMARGGRAWRGYFPVGGELTSGKPDMKEGIYFGTELSPDHPRVRARVPLHGANLLTKCIRSNKADPLLENRQLRSALNSKFSCRKLPPSNSDSAVS